jgi:hypothetical protein
MKSEELRSWAEKTEVLKPCFQQASLNVFVDLLFADLTEVLDARVAWKDLSAITRIAYIDCFAEDYFSMNEPSTDERIHQKKKSKNYN